MMPQLLEGHLGLPDRQVMEDEEEERGRAPSSHSRATSGGCPCRVGFDELRERSRLLGRHIVDIGIIVAYASWHYLPAATRLWVP